MDYQTETQQNFGTELQRERFSSGKIFVKRIKYYVMVLLAAVFAAAIATDPYYAETGSEDLQSIMLFVCLGVALFFLLLSFLLVRPAELVIYEEGFVFTRGRKVTEVGYNQIGSVYRTTDSIFDIFFLFGLVGVLISWLPIFQVRKLHVYGPNGNRVVVLRHRRTPDFKRMTKELEQVFAWYRMRGITAENIAEITISFHEELELKGGQLIHTEKKWRKTESKAIPFESIYQVTETEPVQLLGHPDERGRHDSLVNLGDAGRNVELLRRIVEMMKSTTG